MTRNAAIGPAISLPLDEISRVAYHGRPHREDICRTEQCANARAHELKYNRADGGPEVQAEGGAR